MAADDEHPGRSPRLPLDAATGADAGPTGDAPVGARRDLVRVLVDVEPAHLDRPFDYLLGDADPDLAPGWRVEVTFGGRRRRALVIERPDDTQVEPARLRRISKVLGDYPWVTPDELAVVEWAAHRWGATRADVLRHALPGRAVAVERAFREQELLPWRADPPRPRWEATGADVLPPGWTPYQGGQALFDDLDGGGGPRLWRPLADDDVAARLGEAITACVAGGRDAMVVVPDAGSRIAARLVSLLRLALAPHGVARDQVVDVTGLTTGSAITRAWLRARTGQARVVVGERRVAFWPLAAPGLFVVLDEANPALKERRAPRHHAREVALERARRSNAVALAVGVVPSAAAWALVQAGRLATVAAPRAAEVAAAPRVIVDDHHRVRLGRRGIGALREAVAAGGHGVVLAARRGEGRAMVCRSCGHRPTCPTCGSSLAGHRAGLDCPTCGWRVGHRRCGECGGHEFVPLAAGTQRLAAELRQTVDAPVVVLEGYDASVPPPPSVLVMTRGSVLDLAPGPVGAVVAGDLDALVRRPAVDAPEDTLRLLATMATWVGSSAPGIVVVVTREPDGPVPTALRRWDPDGFWRGEEAVRAPFPPVRTAIAVTAPDVAIAERVRAAVEGAGTLVLGPVEVARGQRCLVLAEERVPTVAALAHLRVELSAEGHALAIDVEPVALG